MTVTSSSPSPSTPTTQYPASSALALEGRTAIVTGSSSGLGRSIALRLAQLGCVVVCCDLAPSQRGYPAESIHSIPTHELIERNNGEGRGFFRPVDVTSYEAVSALVDFAVGTASPRGRLDIMVNNAGIGGHEEGSPNQGIHTERPEFAAKVMQVNWGGVWNGTRAATTQMLKQSIELFPSDLDISPYLGDVDQIDIEGQIVPAVEYRGSRGTIINMGSIHGLVAGPCEPAYSAAKSAVINLTRTVALDYAKDRINCNCICPGYCAVNMLGKPIAPEISARRICPWPHQGAARDIARAVIYLARDAPWNTGAVMAVDGGTTAM